jgi:hypothetical protein
MSTFDIELRIKIKKELISYYVSIQLEEGVNAQRNDAIVELREEIKALQKHLEVCI